MPQISFRTKGNASSNGKPRIYFTCHPDDFERHFDKICADIFSVQDCAVYYTADMTEAFDEEEKTVDLGSNNLFVLPVTFKLLSTPCRAMDTDLAYAKAHRIPILPIMMERGIDDLYARPQAFGELQYLNPYSKDETEVGYTEKLRKHLSSVLVSDEIQRRIRSAFDNYIFLSYRKKDRRHANALMRLIHANEEYEGVAIWFDEFLTPGESFCEGIVQMISQSALFALLVTPNLLEKYNGIPNYVMGTEYPLARKAGMPILPIEMLPTDRTALETEFVKIPACIDPYNKIELNAALAQLLSEHTCKKSTRDAEHQFLMGLAYLDGIDVETDREHGLRLIRQAAEGDFPDAMDKLCDIYSRGICVPLNYNEALVWAKRLRDHHVATHGKESEEALAASYKVIRLELKRKNLKEARRLCENTVLIAQDSLPRIHPLTKMLLSDLSEIYRALGELDAALEIALKLYAFYSRILGEQNKDTCTVLNNLATIYLDRKDYQKALGILEQLRETHLRELGDEHPSTLITLGNIASAQIHLERYESALDILKDLYRKRCSVFGETHPYSLDTLHETAYVYSKLEDHGKAMELYQRVIELSRRILGGGHPDTLVSIGALACEYDSIGEHEKALELKEYVYQQEKTVLGEEHPNTLNTKNNLAHSYSLLGNHEKEKQYHGEVYLARERLLGELHPDTLSSLYSLSTAHLGLGERQRAIELLKDAYGKYCKTFGKASRETVTVATTLATAYMEEEQYRDAIEWLDVVSVAARSKGEQEPTETVVFCIHRINDTSLEAYRQGDLQKALTIQREVYALRSKYLGEAHEDTLVSLNDMAVMSHALGNVEEALELFEALYAAQCKRFGEEDPAAMATLSNVTALCLNSEEYGKALEYLTKTYGLQCKTLGEAHMSTFDTLDLLFKVCLLLVSEEKLSAFSARLLGAYNGKIAELLSDIGEMLVSSEEIACARKLYEVLYRFRCESTGDLSKESLEVLRILEGLPQE